MTPKRAAQWTIMLAVFMIAYSLAYFVTWLPGSPSHAISAVVAASLTPILKPN